MKKRKKTKTLLMGTIATIGLLSTVTAFAGYGMFYFDIPVAQGWAVSEDDNGNGYVTGSSATNGLVSLEGFTGVSAVSFYAGAWENNGTDNITFPSNGATIYRSDFEEGETDVVVPYGYSRGKGQKMGLKVHNHNWSLNKGAVSGVVDYR